MTIARSGFTLAESLIAMVVLAVAVLAILQAVNAGHSQVETGAHMVQASHLASAMMEEILAHPYHDPQGSTALGPDLGESTRAKFDNVDDYDGWSESMGNVEDASGNGYGEDYVNFSRSVACSYKSINVPDYPGSVSGLEIVVTVTDERGQTWQVTRFLAEPSS